MGAIRLVGVDGGNTKVPGMPAGEGSAAGTTSQSIINAHPHLYLLVIGYYLQAWRYVGS